MPRQDAARRGTARRWAGRPGVAPWGVGLASGLSVLLLVLAALSPIADPERAGRLAAAEEVERARRALGASWQQLLLEGAPAPAKGDSFRWSRPLPAPVPARGANASGPLEEAFELDLEQATRSELVDADLDRARAWVEEALRLPRVSQERRARGQLRRLQLALAAADEEDARAAWEELREEVEWDVVEHGVPSRLIAALAVAPILAGGEREALQAEIVARWRGGELAFEGHGPVLVREGAVVRAQEDPRMGVLRRAVLGLGPAGPEALDEVLERGAARTLLARIGDSGEDARARSWGVRVTELGWFAQGPGDVQRELRGHFVEPDDCARSLAAHAQRAGLLDAGFELAARAPGNAREEEAVPIVLAGGGLSLELWHEASENLGQAERQRALWTRLALVAAALAVGVAGLATIRTLRRERLLGELRSRFIANVSHDLRTPLASILLMAENLESGRVADADSAARYHKKIRSEGARLRRMVDEVLDFSAIEHGERPKLVPSEFELEAFAEELRASFEDIATRLAGELSFECGALPESFVGDPGALRRVFDNLVDNAFKHGSSPVSVRLEADERCLRFEVRDHGQGIAALQRQRVFEPFVRLGEERPGKAPGAGLGLAMARELVQASGGTLVVATPPEGHGTLFVCTLPLDVAHAPGFSS